MVGLEAIQWLQSARIMKISGSSFALVGNVAIKFTIHAATGEWLRMIGALLILFVGSTIMCSAAAALTAVCTNPGSRNLGFGARFKAAYPAWLGAIVIMVIAYAFNAANGRDVSGVSTFVLLAVMFFGGWGALTSVRNARLL
jgi:CBS-domain-containing membrane protein